MKKVISHNNFMYKTSSNIILESASKVLSPFKGQTVFLHSH